MEEEDFILDYGPFDGELEDRSVDHIRGETANQKKGRKCHSCEGRFTCVRRHVLRAHLPWYAIPYTSCWKCKLQFGQTCLLNGHIKQFHNSVTEGFIFTKDNHEHWVELMNGLLETLCEELSCSSLQELCDLAEKHVSISKNSEPVFQDEDMTLLSIFKEINNYGTIPKQHKVQLPFNIYSLLHWKLLSTLIFKTDIKENILSTETRKSLKPLTRISEETRVQLVDSHFHLDMLTKKTGRDTLPSYLWKWGESQYQIRKLIANYCYPRNWPSSTTRSTIRKDDRIYLTFGIHPRIVEMESPRNLDSWISQLEDKMDITKVVAVGECGLDNSGNQCNIRKQIKYFEKQVKLAVKKHLPIVIYCRGDRNIDEQCLNSLVSILGLPSQHKVHRLCFNGTVNMYNSWKSALPNCKFGISPFILLDEKHPNFRSLLCDMDIKDLIIETDAPYLHPSTHKFGSPLLLQDIITKLAGIYSCSVDEVAEITTRNALKLYNIK